MNSSRSSHALAKSAVLPCCKTQTLQSSGTNLTTNSTRRSPCFERAESCYIEQYDIWHLWPSSQFKQRFSNERAIHGNHFAPFAASRINLNARIVLSYTIVSSNKYIQRHTEVAESMVLLRNWSIWMQFDFVDWNCGWMLIALSWVCQHSYMIPHDTPHRPTRKNCLDKTC